MMLDKFSTEEYLFKLDKYFRASNYLSVAQLYLLDNPLLRKPLSKEHIKRKIVGHWGSAPGQNFVYAHLNRVINKYDLNVMLISGPGHAGNFFVANSYLEGVYSEIYPEISQDIEGLTKLCKRFSFPGGVSSHVSPEVPGSIHEGGELGYSLAHAYGSVLDNPDLITACIVGDGEAETGPLATSWHLNKFINPETDGIVLPILHLNGYKINNPTILSRIPRSDLIKLFSGYGYEPYLVEGKDTKAMHKSMAKAMDCCIRDIKAIKRHGKGKLPMVILVSPKGWTCPKEVNGLQVEGSFRAHQVPVTINKKEDMFVLEDWLKSYKIDEIFDENCKLYSDVTETIPKGNKRISANIYTNGGKLSKQLVLPEIEKYLLDFKKPGKQTAQDMLELGGLIRDIMDKNPTNYRIFSPDEAMSNRLNKVFDTQNRTFDAKIIKTDDHLATNGRVFDSFLSEHICEGLLEGYNLTGRYGMFASYEAFIRVVDSMVSQHIKWLVTADKLPWRAHIPALNLILTSNVWQQDHNGFTHQDPGFLDHIITKSPQYTNVYLPPDTNTLLYTYYNIADSKNEVNTIVASKHPSYQWFTPKKAKELVQNGLGIVDFACLNNSDKPDIILASCGATPTIETFACVSLIKEYLPNLNVRVVNIVDLLKLESPITNPKGISDQEYDNIFTKDKHIIFNFHGYPKLIHQLTYKRTNQKLHVSGYQENGTITTPFDMRVRNKIDRYHLLKKVLKYIKITKTEYNKINQKIDKILAEHEAYITQSGVDMPAVADWEFK